MSNYHLKENTKMSQTLNLHIEGMTCGHCKAHVEKALAATDGVTQFTVDLAGQSATIEARDDVSPEALIAAVDEAGYTASLA